MAAPKTKTVLCSGSSQRGTRIVSQVGNCRACGVRTFVRNGIIQPHKASI